MPGNLLEQYPKARKTKLPGLYILGRDHFLIQVKATYHGATSGYQGTFQGSFKQAVDEWKAKKRACYLRAKERRIAEVKERLTHSKLKFFR